MGLLEMTATSSTVGKELYYRIAVQFVQGHAWLSRPPQTNPFVNHVLLSPSERCPADETC